MINKLKYALISDIGVYDPTFYEPEEEENLVAICERWGIDYLPGKDRKSVYKLVGKNFKKHEIDPRLIVKPYYRIFDYRTIENLGNYKPNEVRLIVEDGSIKGVMHITDYNNEFIQVELYRALYKFEVNLRKFLRGKKINDLDFIKWVKHQSENNKDSGNRYYWGQRYKDLMPEDEERKTEVILKRKELNPFQTLYLKELMQYTVSEGMLDKKHIDIEEINKLRNLIAHSNSPTNIDRNKDEVIYNFDKLRSYVDRVHALFDAYDYLKQELEKL